MINGTRKRIVATIIVTTPITRPSHGHGCHGDTHRNLRIYQITPQNIITIQHVGIRITENACAGWKSIHPSAASAPVICARGAWAVSSLFAPGAENTCAATWNINTLVTASAAVWRMPTISGLNPTTE